MSEKSSLENLLCQEECLGKKSCDFVPESIAAGLNCEICQALVGVPLNAEEERISYHPYFTSQVVAAFTADYEQEIVRHNCFGMADIDNLKSYLIQVVAHSDAVEDEDSFKKVFQTDCQNEELINFLTKIHQDLENVDTGRIARNTINNLIARLQLLEILQLE